MQISQETALLIDTLATAASKIGSTPASAKLNALIVELLPPSELDEAQTMIAALQAERSSLQLTIESLSGQVSTLQASNDFRQANLELRHAQLSELAITLDTAISEVATPEEREAALLQMVALLDTALAPVDA